jgi:hypothetical protein
VKPWHGIVVAVAILAVFALFSMTVGSRVIITNHVGVASRAPK